MRRNRPSLGVFLHVVGWQCCLALVAASVVQGQAPTPIAQWSMPAPAGCPAGVAVSPSGYVLVVDQGAARVVEFQRDGTVARQWGFFGTGNGEFGGPIGVSVDSNGRIYVADTGNDRIQVFDSTGVYLSQFGVVSPSYLVFDLAGNLYVTASDRVAKYAPSGALLQEWGTHGAGPGQFDAPQGICVDAAGNIDIADGGNHRIQQFTTDGQFVRMWAVPGVGGQFPAVLGLEADPRGYVYAVDLVNKRVLVFSTGGDVLTTWDVGVDPNDIARDKSGELFVTDCGTRSVYWLSAQPTSTVRSSWGRLKASYR